MSAIAPTVGSGARPGPTSRVPSSAGEALELLVEQALHPSPAGTVPSASVTAAADLVRSSITEQSVTQSALTEALIACQDRLHDLEMLAQISIQAITSGETLDLLLDRALQLTGASQILLLEEGTVLSFRGDPACRDEHAALARTAIAEAPRSPLRAAASDTAMIGTLDADGGARRHVAFFRSSDQPFATPDIPLVEAIRSALAVMLAFTDLHQRELARAAVEREHQLASELAQSVITDTPPDSPLLDLFARTVPASVAGGDFYVFGQSDGLTWIAVGDVAGKGLPAAMLMTRAVSACRVAFLAQRDRPVTDVFARIEDEVFDHLDEAGLFLTLAVALIDEATCTVSVVNAGHSPVVLVRDGVAESIRPSVPPLGIVRHRVPEITTFPLRGDDCLFLGSDGLVEQSDPGEELFGYARFSELCEATHQLPSREAGARVFESVDSFASGAPASDDSTLVVVSAGSPR